MLVDSKKDGFGPPLVDTAVSDKADSDDGLMATLNKIRLSDA